MCVTIGIDKPSAKFNAIAFKIEEKYPIKKRVLRK